MDINLKIFLSLVGIILFSACGETTEEQPKAEFSNLNRDSIYYILHELYNKQDYKSAESLIEKIREKGDADINYFTMRAKIKYNCSKFSESLFAINSALSINPNNSGLYFLKSMCFISLDLKDSSLYYLTKAIDLDTTNAGYIASRSRMYKLLKIPVLQYDDINRLIKLDTSNIEYKSNLYLFYYENGDTASAINGYNNSLKKDPNNFNAIRSLGFIYFNSGKNKLAKPYFKKIIDLNPTDSEVFFAMASILSKEKNKEKEACDCLLRSLELGNQEAGKHLYKCDEYLRKKGIIIQADTLRSVEEPKRVSTEI